MGGLFCSLVYNFRFCIEYIASLTQTTENLLDGEDSIYFIEENIRLFQVMHWAVDPKSLPGGFII